MWLCKENELGIGEGVGRWLDVDCMWNCRAIYAFVFLGIMMCPWFGEPLGGEVGGSGGGGSEAAIFVSSRNSGTIAFLENPWGH